MKIKELKKKTITGVGVFFVQTIFLNLLGLITNFVLMFYFTQEDFGIYGFVIQIIGLLNFFSDIGLASSLIQKKQEPTEADYQTVFFIQQVLSWTIVIVIFLILKTNFVYNKVGAVGNWILVSLAFSFPLASLKTIPSIKLIRKLNFTTLVIPQIVESVFFNLILIFMAIANFKAYSYVVAILVRSIVGVVVIYWLCPWKIRLNFCKKNFHQLIKFGFKFQINDLLARIKDQFFYLFLGVKLNLGEFGFLNWAKGWSMYPYNLTVQNILNITFPTFTRIQDNKKLLQRAIEKSIFFITLVIFPILITMCLFIYPLTSLVSRYQKWQPALLSFVLFTASVGLAAFSSPLTNALNAIGKINQTLKLMIFWTIATWILSPILMYFYGFNGVAWAALIISFSSFLPVLLVKKEVPFNFWSNINIQLLSSVLMISFGILTLKFWSQNMASFLLGIVVVNLFYLLMLLLFGRKKLFLELKVFRVKND